MLVVRTLRDSTEHAIRLALYVAAGNVLRMHGIFSDAEGDKIGETPRSG